MKYAKPLQLFKDVLERKASGRPRLLGLDVGDKYIGLAVSDPNNKIASPVSFLHRKKANIDLMATNFQRLVSEYNLAGVIVGYPLNRQQIARDAVQVKVFVDELCNTGRFEGLAYTYWDECFTTRNVEFLLKPLNLHQLKIMLDKFAAVGILQAYLDSVNKQVKLEAEEQTNVGSFNEVVNQFNCITKPFEAEGKRKL